MPEIAQWLVVAISVIALIVPFTYKLPPGEGRLEPIFVGLLIRNTKPRTHEIVAAAVFVTIVPLGVYAGFATGSPEAVAIAVAAPAILLVCLSLIVSKKVTRVVLV